LELFYSKNEKIFECFEEEKINQNYQKSLADIEICTNKNKIFFFLGNFLIFVDSLLWKENSENEVM